MAYMILGSAKTRLELSELPEDLFDLDDFVRALCKKKPIAKYR